MTKIFGFDPSKSTGWAIFEPEQQKIDRNYSSARRGVFQMPDKADHYYTGDQIGLKVAALIREHGKPDWVVLEEQSLAKIGNTSADAMLYPWIATTAIVSTIANFGIPYGTLPPGTWRKSFYGQTFKPPLDSKTKKDWKAAAVAQCELIGIKLPTQKTLAHNAAEACALAICWGVRDMKVHAGRYQQPLMDLRMARNERAGVAA